jgi:Cu/Ag efflux pump CusA
MQDLLWQLNDTDSFTVYTTAAFVAAVFWFIREFVGAPALAIFAVPFLMAGGVFAPLVFRSQMITISYDKDANVAAMTGIGVLSALIALVVVKWLWACLKERQVRNTKIAPATKLTRPTR